MSNHDHKGRPIRSPITLVMGQYYRVELEDCCLEIDFIGQYDGARFDEDGDAEVFVFKVGGHPVRIGPNWVSGTFTAVPA